jgi:HK97 family phage prohead protease
LKGKIKMEADFSGYATKAGLKCSDGRTIMADAFKHQDKVTVPLVWQHGHSEPTNVLGHAVLEARPDGIYAYGYFNSTPAAQHIKESVAHGDIKQMSIWANSLVERSKQVFHGLIREVSLVLSGANPGALIENVTIRHSDGIEDVLDDEAIIYTGLSLQHADGDTKSDTNGEDEESLDDIYESMNEKQQNLLHYMVFQAASGNEALAQSSDEDAQAVKAFYDSLTDEQKQVLHTMVTGDGNDDTAGDGNNTAGEVGESGDAATSTETTGEVGESGDAATSTETTDDTNNSNVNDTDDPKGTEMKHNVFEKDGEKAGPVLSHADIEGIVADATKVGSLKEAVESYALAHGIQDIDILFPEAKTIASTPELFGRRVEWVNDLLSGVRKSPFTRIKTMSADLTVQEARAKGYIKGTMKKEEFFRVSKRVTTPQTIYKKQKLDRDDILDITDFDVVTWLKGEMRLMLDEELARAILVGDGRAVDDEDKINEDNIRPVASDNEVYTTTVNVNIGNANSSAQEIVDAIVSNRRYLRGSGTPTMYTKESVISTFLLLKDTLGRRIYRTLDEVASELRVDRIVPVEVLEEHDDVLAIIFNPSDYVVGADKGGNVSMFDDFDIDYNQHKYLIETRVSGALVKLKAALVVRSTDAASVETVPAEPAFDGEAITITDQAGVVYRNAETDAVMNAAGSPYAVADGETVTVNAEPAAGYHFPSSENDSWNFTGTV